MRQGNRFTLEIGQVFHRLTIIGSPVARVRPSGERCAIYPCRCKCGERVEVEYRGLVRGITKSCGCLQREWATAFKTRHGGDGTRLHRIWSNMVSRCKYPSMPAYRNYGGRGITVCDTWRSFEGFRGWALANGYRDDLTIERIDVNGHYEPSNCTWIPLGEQAYNWRKSRKLTAFGETKVLSQWARDPRCRMSAEGLRDRITAGWEAEAAIATPPYNQNARKG